MANVLRRRGSLTVWFDPEMIWEAEPTGKRGRQRDCSDAAIQTCLTLKGDTRKCHDAIADRGAAAFGHALEPVALVPSLPPRRNARPWKPTTAGARARNEAFRPSKYLGRARWRRWSEHHRRSRTATKMHCVKLLGQRLSAREFDRQVAELQIRIAVLNGFAALGIPITEAMG